MPTFFLRENWCSLMRIRYSWCVLIFNSSTWPDLKVWIIANNESSTLTPPSTMYRPTNPTECILGAWLLSPDEHKRHSPSLPAAWQHRYQMDRWYLPPRHCTGSRQGHPGSHTYIFFLGISRLISTWAKKKGYTALRSRSPSFSCCRLWDLCCINSKVQILLCFFFCFYVLTTKNQSNVQGDAATKETLHTLPSQERHEATIWGQGQACWRRKSHHRRAARGSDQFTPAYRRTWSKETKD